MGFRSRGHRDRERLRKHIACLDPNSFTVTSGIGPDGGTSHDRSFLANFLASNNWAFDLQEPPTDIAISAARAIEIVASRTKGPIKKADAVFGVLHANLGAIAPPKAWLVVLVGPGFIPAGGALPTGSPNAAAASFAQAQNFYFAYAFVEASGGSLLMAGGSSPPP